MIAWTLAQPSERALLGQGRRLFRQLPRAVRGATTTCVSVDSAAEEERPRAPRLMACLLAAAQIFKSK